MKKLGFKNLIRKKSTGIVVTVVAFAITIGAIFTVSNLTLAKDSLPGIVDIRNEMARDDEVYTVLEIVPDLQAAEFGYLVGGEEPLDVATLYDSENKDWITWKEYLTVYADTMTEAMRIEYLENLVANNADYISIGQPSMDKPMWYEPYIETGVTSADADGVLYGGSIPVYGELTIDNSRGIGWNAKFTNIGSNKTYSELMAEKTPYYIVDTVREDGEVAITAEAIEGSAYPDYYYTYKKDVTNTYYVPAVTFGELKADYNDGGLMDDSEEIDDLANYYILKFKVLTESDFTETVGPKVYMASDIVYVETGAPYVITKPSDKGHSLSKPANNVYYQGGLYSNEMFKQYSMDLDAEELAEYKVDVQTVTPGELNALSQADLAAYMANVDFIYINAGDATYKYDSASPVRDLTLDVVKVIFEKICNEKTPCIVDYYLIESGLINPSINNAKVRALTCMLMQKNYREILSDKTLNINVIETSLSGWIDNVTNNNINNYNYVNGNVMVINSTLTNNRLTDSYYGSVYEDDIIAEAYQAVLKEIDIENMYRAADQVSGHEQLSTDIYKSTIVRYIMNYYSARAIEEKTAFEVLEIQPANVQYSENSTSEGAVGRDKTEKINEKELTPARVKNWLGLTDKDAKNVTINITTMTSVEFIGTIEDLNSKYDLIYIGADIYGLTRKEKTEGTGKKQIKYQETSYGDTNMNGLVYCNVGSSATVGGQFAGHLKTDWVSTNTVKASATARYNGNDITADKYNKLVDYVKGTYPVIVSDTLCASTTAPDGYYVDNCSYMYSFLEQHLKDASVFKASEVDAGTNTNFQFYANRGKLCLGEKVVASEETKVKGTTAFVQPGILATVKEGYTDTTDGEVTYLEKENGKYYLKYKFTITNNGAVFNGTTYTAALYLDGNSDGKFSVEYEELQGVMITHVASGKIIKNGELIAGEQYVLSKEVPEQYSGLLTWKVEVRQTTNKYIRNSVTGYTKLLGTPKATIKVLQIHRDGGTPLILADAIGSSKGAGSNDTLDALYWGGTLEEKDDLGNTIQVNYEGISDEYDFQFTTLSNAGFNAKTKESDFNLDYYDIIILGFYDAYDYRKGKESDIDENAVNKLKAYIDSGKCVMFAHDTTSITVVPDHKQVYVQGSKDNLYVKSGSDCYVWGYYLNMYIRDMVGLDTYGITLGETDDVDYTVIRSGNALSTTGTGKEYMAALKNTLDENGYYKIGLKPVAYEPKSNKERTVPHTQGFAYPWMDGVWKGNNSTSYRYESTVNYNSDRAERINQGAITTYPYYLDQTIDITRTHHQYFSIDLNTDTDEDGETDLVVWYTMGGKVGDSSHQDQNGWYNESNYDDVSEKDVMNSYYIYSKGNVIYTGFGDIDSDSWLKRAVVVEECKLFINTLVAAYNLSAKPPQFTTYESEDSLVPATSFYEYGDVDNDVAFRSGSQRMYFKITDPNVTSGTKSAYVDYYVKLKDGTVSKDAKSYTVNGTTYKVEWDEDDKASYIKLDNLVTYDTSNKKIELSDEVTLKCNIMYYVDIPIEVFDIPGVDGQNVNTFRAVTRVEFKKIGIGTGTEVTVSPDPSKTYIDFVHVELFPLD